jgi:hypothetical protein
VLDRLEELGLDMPEELQTLFYDNIRSVQ